MALFEIDKFQMSFSASEGALFFFLFFLFVCLFFASIFFVCVFRNAKLVNPSSFYAHNDAK